MKKNEKEFKAVEFMRSARARLTKKYQTDNAGYMKELEEATKEFLQLRKKLASK